MKSSMLTAAVSWLAISLARADLPSYNGFELQARTALTGAFHITNGYSISSFTPDINDAGQVTFRAQGPTTQHIWYGANGNGGIVYSPPADNFLADPTINASGLSVWSTTQATGITNGVYVYNPAAGSGAFYTNRPLGNTTWGSPQINASGAVGFRGNFAGSGQFFAAYSPGTNQATILASETGVEPSSPYAFLFTPAFNDAGKIAGKVRLGSTSTNQDQIRIFDSNPANPSVLVAQTRDLDPASPFTRLDNSFAFNNAGDIAFEGTSFATGTRGLFLYHGGQITTVALSNPAGMLRDLNFFSPDINDFGLIAFRGKDLSNNDAIFVSDGVNLLRLIGVGDAIQTDLGADSIIAISGKPNLNKIGEVVFNVNLASGGAGVFVAQVVPEPASVTLFLYGGLFALAVRRARSHNVARATGGRFWVAAFPALFFLSCCGSGRGTDETPPARAEIIVSITPGKPGAPTETVKAKWDGKKSSLEVQRGVEGATPERTETDLPEAEFRKLWRLVAANELSSFQPEKKNGQVFDFGTRSVEISSASQPDEPMKRHAITWEEPLTNENKVEPIMKEMGRLATQYASSVQLNYFPATH